MLPWEFLLPSESITKMAGRSLLTFRLNRSNIYKKINHKNYKIRHCFVFLYLKKNKFLNIFSLHILCE